MNTTKTTNSISRHTFMRSLLIGVPMLSVASALAQTETPAPPPEAAPDAGNLRTFVELARADIRRLRATIFAENLTLTEDQAVDFWPVERDYETELGGLLDERYAAIKQYVSERDTLTNDQAVALAKTAFDLEEKRTALKRKYFKKFCTVVPATTAAQFFQIDNQLNMVLDLRLAGALPLIK